VGHPTHHLPWADPANFAHGDRMVWHEYTVEFEEIYDVTDIKSLVREFFTPLREFYRGHTVIIALVGRVEEVEEIDDETGQSRRDIRTETQYATVNAVIGLDAAFGQVNDKVDRWMANTPYKGLYGLAVHCVAPEWYQP
jgi:hypothetical protein